MKMITKTQEDEIKSKDQISPSYARRTKLTQSLIDRIGGIIIVVGGVLAFWGFFLPVAIFSDMVHHPIVVEGGNNVTLPSIASLVIGIGIALAIKPDSHPLVYLSLGIAILIGLIAHFFFTSSFLYLTPPLSIIGYFDFGIGALLPFIGFFLSLAGLIVCLIRRKGPLTG